MVTVSLSNTKSHWACSWGRAHDQGGSVHSSGNVHLGNHDIARSGMKKKNLASAKCGMLRATSRMRALTLRHMAKTIVFMLALPEALLARSGTMSREKRSILV
jgi:hypothetical protein